jgi:hypothetical protein
MGDDPGFTQTERGQERSVEQGMGVSPFADALVDSGLPFLWRYRRHLLQKLRDLGRSEKAAEGDTVTVRVDDVFVADEAAGADFSQVYAQLRLPVVAAYDVKSSEINVTGAWAETFAFAVKS